MPKLHQKQPKIAGIVNVTLAGVRSREIPAPPIPPPAHTSAANALPGCSPRTHGSVPPAPGRASPTALPDPTPRLFTSDLLRGDAASDAASAERGAAPGTHSPGDQESGWRAAPGISTPHTPTQVTPEGPSPASRPSRRTNPAHTCTGSPSCNEIPGDRQEFRRRKAQGKLPRSCDSAPQLTHPSETLSFSPLSTSPNSWLRMALTSGCGGRYQVSGRCCS